MEHASKGAKALANSDPATAVVEYTLALIEHPTSPEYYVQRSVALSRVRPARWDLALQDADMGVLAGYKRGKKDAIQAAQQRRLVCFYNLGRYADAKVILDNMPKPDEKQKSKQMEQSIWATKIEAKLKDASEQAATATVKVEGSMPDANIQRNIIRKQLKKDGKFNYDGVDEAGDDGIPAVNPDKALEGKATSSDQSVKSSNSAGLASGTTKIRHEWYQSSTAITLTIYAKNVSKDQAEIEINADSVHVSFPQPHIPSATYDLSLDPLFALIDPSKSQFKIMSTKVELTLIKAVAGQKWANLEGTAPLTQDIKGTNGADDIATTATMSSPQQPHMTAPAYPTSSRSGPKNWDKLADDLTKPKTKKPDKEKGKKKADGQPDDDSNDIDYDAESGDEVDGFFKKLYQGSDADTQRAMMKSMYESHGTTLSTNWADVSKGRVKPYEEKDKD